MSMVLAPALQLVAAEVAATPLLGYQIVEFSRPGEGGTVEVIRQLRESQPWIEIENGQVTINIERFRAHHPLARYLGMEAAEWKFFLTLPEALADFGSRWAISPQPPHGVSSSPNRALAVDG